MQHPQQGRRLLRAPRHVPGCTPAQQVMNESDGVARRLPMFLLNVEVVRIGHIDRAGPLSNFHGVVEDDAQGTVMRAMSGLLVKVTPDKIQGYADVDVSVQSFS